MKKNNRLCRVALILLSLVLTVTMLSSCGLVTILIPLFLPSNSIPDFDSLEYERPDFDEITESFREVIDMIDGKKSNLRIQIKLSNAYGLYNDAYTQYSLLQIQYYNDTTDTEASDELAYCSEKFSELSILLKDVYVAIVDGGYADSLLPSWTEEDYAYLELQKKLYDEEYSSLSKERTEIENEYVALTTSITVNHGGKAITIEEAAALYMTGRIDAETYNRLVVEYYQKLNEKAAPLYFRLVEIDNRCAEKAGLSSYTEYYYRYVYSREYTPEDARKVHAYVKEKIVPLYRELTSNIDGSLLQSALYGLNDPIESYDKIIERYAKEISPSMSEAYSALKKYNLSSIGNEAGKQNAGFTTYLPSYNVPYLFLYTRGDLDDVASFVHEFGHFFAFYYNGLESDSIIDVSEIQSQANEWLFAPYYDLSDEEKEQYLAYRLSNTLSSIIEGCLFDEFQQEVYSGAIRTPDEANEAFSQLAEEYSLDYGYEIEPYLWTAVHHNFTSPFYYISYAMSAIPSLEIYALSLEDRSEAIRVYLNIVDENGYRPFLNCLSDNDLASPFEEEAYLCIETLVKNTIASLAGGSDAPLPGVTVQAETLRPAA